MVRYGITEGDYAAKLAAQNGVCAICKSPPGQKRLHVDHDHETGVVRDLLCSTCNHLVGWVESPSGRLEACCAYVARHAT